ncbi:MAG: cysteine desulfurase NifS [Pontiella sp.]
MDKAVYLDHNATTPVAPEVLDAMLPFFKEQWGNPSSLHTVGNRAKRAVDQARQSVATLLGATDASEIVFTSGGTESNNLALRGAAKAMRKQPRIITSQVEHVAVLEPCDELEVQGFSVSRIPVDSDGLPKLSKLKEAIDGDNDSILASFMWANNETGVLLPIYELANLVKEADGIFHTDAVQAVGKLPINVQDVPVDLLSLSGHKLYAPKGIGALYVRRGTRISSQNKGGHQERGRRGGTENVPYIVGLGKACEIAMRQFEEDACREARLRDRLEQEILTACEGAVVNGGNCQRLPNTTNISFKYLEGEAILLMFDDQGICVSTGSACQSGSIEASHVLKAMQLKSSLLQGAIRFSLGRYTTEVEIDYVLATIPGILDRLKTLSPHYKK